MGNKGSVLVGEVGSKLKAFAGALFGLHICLDFYVMVGVGLYLWFIACLLS
jgi:hypothetical protein